MIPQEGDCVKYRLIEIPPNYIKTQAVQVTLINESKLLSDGEFFAFRNNLKFFEIQKKNNWNFY